MTSPQPSIGEALSALWQEAKGTSEGRLEFSKALGQMVPYTGSIGAVVRELTPGSAFVELAEHPAILNHLASIHAVALMNLAELTTGLALLPSLGGDVRGILRGLTISYEKKARGLLVAAAHVTLPEITEDIEMQVEATITDEEGDTCAIAVATWRLGPVQ